MTMVPWLSKGGRVDRPSSARVHGLEGRGVDMVGTILMALVAGAIIGPLARFVLPGRQHIGFWMTVILGAVGSVVGAWIYYKITGVSDTKGIDWTSGLIGVVVAAALIVGYAMIRGSNKPTT